MTIANNINKLLTLHNMKPAELARKSGVSQPRIHEIVNEMTKNPRMETLKKISEAFCVTVDELTGTPPMFNDGEAVVGRHKQGFERPEGAFDVPTMTRRIPIISWAQAGADGFFEDSYPVGCGFGYITWFDDLKDENAYALIIAGESMSPKYEPGDIIILSPNAGTITGDYAVVRLRDGQVMAKKIKNKNSHFVLSSLNPEFEDIVCQKEEIKFIHKIVGTRQRG